MFAQEVFSQVASSEETTLGHTLELVSPILGEYVLGSEDATERMVTSVLLDTPYGRRTLGISQLSTTKAWETIPGTSRFSRFGHIADLAKMIIDTGRARSRPEAEIRAQIRVTAFPDGAQGPFSHYADIAVEGVGQTEDFHDYRKTEAQMAGGAWHPLRRHAPLDDYPGYLRSETLPPWAECSAPRLCTDRLQYNGCEGVLWYDNVPGASAEQIQNTLRAAVKPEQLFVNGDQNFVFEDADVALVFAKQALLHGTEHWAHPAKRLQQYLLVGAIQSEVLQGSLPATEMLENDWGERNPLDCLYALDSDVVRPMQYGDDPYLALVDAALTALGAEARAQFKTSVGDYMQFVLDEQARDYPSAEGFAYSTIVDEAPYGGINLPAPKYRWVDPLVRTARGDQPLSSVSAAYKAVLAAHQARQAKTHHVTALHITEGGDDAAAYNELLYNTRVASDNFGFELERNRRVRPHPALPAFMRRAGHLALDEARERGVFSLVAPGISRVTT